MVAQNYKKQHLNHLVSVMLATIPIIVSAWFFDLKFYRFANKNKIL
jgi:hypothetical protein